MSSQSESNGAVCLNSQLPLFRALLPRSQLFAFFNGAKLPLWSGSEEHLHHLKESWETVLSRQLANRDEDQPGVRMVLPSGCTAYAFDVVTSGGASLGAFVTVLPVPNDGEPQAVGTVAKLIAPALRVFTRELQTARAMTSMKQTLVAQKAELELLYDIEDSSRGEGRLRDELKALLERCVSQLRVSLLAVIVPERDIQVAVQSAQHPVENGGRVVRQLQALYPKVARKAATITIDADDASVSEDCQPLGYQVVACPIRVGGGRVIGMLTLLDRPDRGRLTQRGQRIAEMITRRATRLVEESYDLLTGIINRREYEARLKTTLANPSGRHAMLHLDIDKLHVINDTFGHGSGDEVIVRMASILQDLLSADDVIGRLGGDDFAVLLPHSRVESACELAEKMCTAARDLHYVRGDQSVRMSLSVGVVAANGADASSDVMAAAEVACKAAKDHGRNRVEVFDVGDSSIIRRHSELHVVHAVNQALERDAFELFAQRIGRLEESAGHVHYELLLRMVGENGRHILPAEFLPTAERYQIMPEIDRWVVRNALEKLAPLRDTLIQRRALFAINLSGQTIGDDSFLDFLGTCFEETGVPENLICFEITETAAVANLDKARRFIEELRLRGCRFSLDDFGAGLSSFAYLKSLPVDYLKIDGGFVRDIDESRVSESMVVAIQQVARIMELETIAEGVESDSTCTRLKAIGVDFVQGFGIDRPMPLKDLLEEISGGAEQQLQGLLAPVGGLRGA